MKKIIIGLFVFLLLYAFACVASYCYNVVSQNLKEKRELAQATEVSGTADELAGFLVGIRWCGGESKRFGALDFNPDGSYSNGWIDYDVVSTDWGEWSIMPNNTVSNEGVIFIDQTAALPFQIINSIRLEIGDPGHIFEACDNPNDTDDFLDSLPEVVSYDQAPEDY